MLLAGIHLMPDLSGALVCPKERLVAVSDPIGDWNTRQAPALAAEALKRLGSLLRQRRPAKLVWLGDALPNLLAAGKLAKREADEVARQCQAVEWHWVAESLPAGLPSTSAVELTMGGLTYRHIGKAAATAEVSCAPWPLATTEAGTWPCYVIDGKRLVIPPFGPRADGMDVLSPHFQALFRRPFNVLMLAGGRIVTRHRSRLTAPGRATT